MRKVEFGTRPLLAYNMVGNSISDFTPAMNSAGSTVNIMIWGDIGEWWGVNKHSIYWALKGMDVAYINVFISSYGGVIDEAFVMYDLLKSHPAKTTCYLLGMCCSSATIIACAGQWVVMSKQCLFMIHKPMVGAFGDADAHDKAKQILDKYQNAIVDIYARKTGMDADKLNSLVNSETWLEAGEALSLGFADEVVDTIPVDFLLPEGGTSASPLSDYYDDGYSYYDQQQEYRVAASALLSKGMRPANQADMSNYINSPISQTDGSMSDKLLKKAVIALQATGAIAANANVDALVKTLSENKDLATDLQDETVEAAVARHIEALKPAAATTTPAPAKVVNLTPETLLSALQAATPEQRAEIAALLPEAEEVPEGEGGTAPDPAVDRMAVLAKTMADVQAEMATMKRGGVVTSPNNGGSPAKAAANTDTPAKPGAEKRLEIALAAYQTGNLTPDAYKAITGKEAPERVFGQN
jgi:ATP-dependent protease ClpP protease subunit